MKVLLMHRSRDFDAQQALYSHAADLVQDLELETLLQAMTDGDEFLHGVARTALLAAANDIDTILYRQAILQDCLAHPEVIAAIYDIAIAAHENRRKSWLGLFGRFPASVLHNAVGLLHMYVDLLRKLRVIAENQIGQFESEGFRRFFAMLTEELGEDYLAGIKEYLITLQFRDGLLASAGLGEGNQGVHFVLHRLPERRLFWLARLFDSGPPGYRFRLHERDEAGARIVGELRERSINSVANALGQSADHVHSFFETLRAELAFYVGCLNLHRRLAGKGEPVCFPQPAPAGEHRYRFVGLYDACLSLHLGQRVVGNTADADGKRLIVITGANQGGKSSFLRAAGLAQIMMQSGMFVAAESFAVSLCSGLFTHYKREEDATMERGKFDEELARLSGIVDRLVPHALLLCNESFAATNEREGSEIARQVVRALLEKGISVFFVTHLYQFAHDCFESEWEGSLFLRAERLADGTRTFNLVEGEPRQTSHGDDLYRSVFTADAHDP